MTYLGLVRIYMQFQAWVGYICNYWPLEGYVCNSPYFNGLLAKNFCTRADGLSDATSLEASSYSGVPHLLWSHIF